MVDCNVQFRFRVQLKEYRNDFNLKYIPQMNSTPYCCCDNKFICFTSTNDGNLNINSCGSQCPLKFTLCAGLTSSNVMKEAEPNTLAPHCFESDVQTGLVLITFDCPSSSNSFFPNQEKVPYFQFPFELHSPNVSVLNI